ncbi:hypothetical protein [Pseudonocardia nigra]|uniref:hypothetical protein n=1 Tax=Pseudonocardia nigra TaxID=1921578 RepID=UPI001FE3ACA5|nr:hypothetical protein [Pseudonocardia nigra]
MSRMNNPGGERGNEDGRSEVLRRADAGAAAWRGVVHAQQAATPDHGEFYELAGFMVETLRALEALAGVLSRQATGYADGLSVGRVVYDDTRAVDPRIRLETARMELSSLVQSAAWADGYANQFWSAIGHIGVEDAPAAPQVSR